jgi:hypothetical protein
MKQSLLFLLLAVVVAASCKKTEDTVSPQDTLRSGKWIMTNVKVKYRLPSQNDTTIDQMKNVPSCMADDYLVFRSNMDGAIDPGSLKCSNSDPSETPFTWEMKNAGQNLYIYNAAQFFGTQAVNSEVVKLSDEYLSIRYNVYNLDTFTTSPTFGHVDTFQFTSTFRRF